MDTEEARDFVRLQDMIGTVFTNPNADTNAFINHINDKYVSNVSLISYPLNVFVSTNNPQLQFFLMELLTKMINANYNGIPEDQKVIIRNTLTNQLQNNLQNMMGQMHVFRKLILLSITWIKYDFPENCPNFFQNYLDVISSDVPQEIKILNLKLIIELMSSFDDEMIKFRHTYTPLEMQRSTIVKDYLRSNFTQNLLGLIQSVIENNNNFEQNIVKLSLEVLCQLIDWNPYDFFQQSMNFVLGTLINIPIYKRQSLNVLNAIIKKGMDIHQKINLLLNVNLTGILSSIFNETNTIQEDPIYESLSEIINNMGFVALNGFGYTVTSKKDKTKFLQDANKDISLMNQSDIDLLKNSSDLFNMTIFMANYILTKTEPSHKLIFLEFMQESTYYLKIILNGLYNTNNGNTSNPPKMKNEVLTSNNEFFNNFQTLVNTVTECLQIPSHMNITQFDISEMDDDEFFEFRKEYSSIYSNFFGINFLKPILLDTIINKFTQMINNQNNITLNQMEHLLYLINLITISETDLNDQNISQKIVQICDILFNDFILYFNDKNILLLYYDTTSKYIHILKNNRNYLDKLFGLFYSDRGINHPNIKIGSKIANTYDKILEKLKGNMNEFLATSMEKLKEFITTIFNTKNAEYIKSYEIVFHSLSTIIQGMVDEPSKYEAYKGVLLMLINNMQSTAIPNENGRSMVPYQFFCAFTKCISQILGYWNSEIKEESLKGLIIEFYNALFEMYKNCVSENTQPEAISSITATLQRIVFILKTNSIGYIDNFFTDILGYLNQENFESLFGLFTNAVTNLSNDSSQIIIDHFKKFYNFIQSINMPGGDNSYGNQLSVKNFVCYEKNLLQLSEKDFFNNVFLTNQNIGVDLQTLIAYQMFLLQNASKTGIKKRSSIKIVGNIFSNVFKTQFKPQCIQTLGGVLTSLGKIYLGLNLNDSSERGSIKEILKIHSLLCGEEQTYLQYLQSLGIEQSKSQELLRTMKQIGVGGCNINENSMNFLGVSYIK
ncbi:MAG: exportin family protein [archaeon]|nr:exportin family protein [archaeon]